MTFHSPDEIVPVRPRAQWACDGAFWLLVVVLAWVPFPLGSNREWSWSILSLGVALCWLPWMIWALAHPEGQRGNLKRIAPSLLLAGAALGWAVVQILPVAPATWMHPVWPVAANILDHPVRGSISLNPWRGFSEIVKLATYMMAAWLAFSLCRGADRAARLLNAVIIIGTVYALYAFVLGMLGMEQFGFFYRFALSPSGFSGSFVQRNSFATFEGLAALAALARLVEQAHARILTGRGLRRMALSVLQFIGGAGAPFLVAVILTVSALVATASRGGAFSALCGLGVMALLSGISASRKGVGRLAPLGLFAVIALLALLVWISGDTLASRFADLADAGGADEVRVALWAASWRMIASAPMLGLGLGSFQDAYPLYATRLLPFIMDKAHSDYLEFAAGLGLPAALCWWSAMALLGARMLLGIFRRRKDRIYPLVGIGATVLVGVHASVDFSLQIPAVAITYACLLGMGMGQASSAQKRDAKDRSAVGATPVWNQAQA